MHGREGSAFGIRQDLRSQESESFFFYRLASSLRRLRSSSLTRLLLLSFFFSTSTQLTQPASLSTTATPAVEPSLERTLSFDTSRPSTTPSPSTSDEVQEEEEAAGRDERLLSLRIVNNRTDPPRSLQPSSSSKPLITSQLNYGNRKHLRSGSPLPSLPPSHRSPSSTSVPIFTPIPRSFVNVVAVFSSRKQRM